VAKAPATPKPVLAPPVPTAAQTLTPTPSPTPTPLLYEDWQYDLDNVLRVRSADLCEAAAFVNLMRRWNIDVDLTPFREAKPQEVAQFDMVETVKQLKFYAVQTDTLSEALRLDLPLLVRLKSQEGKAPDGVIVSMRGDVLEYIDPIHGKQMILRQKLEPLVAKAIVLFQDPMDWAALAPGETGEKVQKLQEWLVKQKVYDGKPDGKFGSQPREAIRTWQQRERLPETGTIDPLMAAVISSELNPRRPRLYS
jgi:hypothetical protein